MTKILLTFLFLLLAFSSPDANAFVSQNCQAYEGLVNKVVGCVTRMVSYGVVGGALNQIYEGIVGISNAAVVIYIAIFGFKLTAGGLKNVRKEAFWVILSAAAILSFNNAVGVKQFLNIFLRAQTEFASAASFAVATKAPEIDENGDIIDNGVESAICFGPKEIVDDQLVPQLDDSGKTVAYGVWKRVDCLIGYIMGAHPIVERTSQYFTPDGEESEIGGVDVSNQRFDYDIFATDANPFTDMATDPFCFLSDTADIDSSNPGSQVPDGCKDKRTTLKSAGSYEVGISFSMFVIAIGMFFESAQSGAMGMMVMFTGIFIVFLMIFAFGQVALVYISSMFAIVVLSLFSPIILPCILFKSTKQIFTSWLQMLFGYTLQPGLMLAYLTFMIFVIQFVITYSKEQTKDDNGNISLGFNSLVDMQFGEMFTKGFKGYSALASTTTNTSSKIDANSEDLADVTGNSGGTVVSSDVSGYTNDGSKLNLSSAQYSQVTRSGVNSQFAQGRALARAAGDFDTNVAGSNDSSVNAPAFKFAVKQCTAWDGNGVCTDYEYINVNQRMSNYIKRQQEIGSGLTKLDTESFISSMQDNTDEITDELSQFQEQEINNKSNYMQVLLVVFLTLSITISFMHNVMNFADRIVGAGAGPVSQMVDIYNMNVSKASKVMRS